MSLADVERIHIQQTLKATGWNKSRTASILGVERSTLDRKIRRYGLAEESTRRVNRTADSEIRLRIAVDKDFDCIVCGSCVVDVLVRPVQLDAPIGGGQLVRTDPLLLTTGGIVSNAGITLARLGMRTAAFTYVGDDEWADVIRSRYSAEGLDTTHLMTHGSAPSSTTAVLIDHSGERSFLHAVGAPKLLNKASLS